MGWIEKRVLKGLNFPGKLEVGFVKFDFLRENQELGFCWFCLLGFDFAGLEWCFWAINWLYVEIDIWSKAFLSFVSIIWFGSNSVEDII